MSAQIKLFAVLIASAAITPILGCRDKVSEQVSTLQSDLAKHLPSTAQYVDVLAYLDKNGIEHSEYKKAENVEELHLLEAPGRVDGVIRKAKIGSISTSDIRLTFLFDGRGRMLSYKVFESVKAP